MSEIANQLLATFETLPAAEQREVVIQLLRRTAVVSESPLTDDDLTFAADELFQILDREEADGDTTAAR